MFRRHRTNPNRDISSVVVAFHGRLAAMLAAPPAARPKGDPADVRVRLAAQATVGLRDRLDRRATT